MVRKFTLAFVVIYALSSCMTSFRISVKKPAVIKLPNEVRKIVLIEDTPNNTTIETAVEGVLSGEQLNGDKVATETFFNGLAMSLRNGNYTSEKVNRSFDKINPTTLDTLFLEHDAQAIIVLKNFDSDAPIGGVVVGNVLGNTQTTLIGKATLNVYFQDKSNIENILVTERFVLPTSGSLNPLAMLQDVVNRQKWYAELGRATGARAGSLFYAPWVWVNRKFYNKGNNDLRQAKNMIRFGNWDIAEKKLTPLLTHAKNKVQARASYNLALVYEGQGRLNDAVTMIEKSALEFNCKKAPDYLRQLLFRQKEAQLIEQQKE
ncbi:MAG TPA: DUF6340 family protein [Crocinitomicaceae bacterium]|nr:DUF6340 family protein [Crocinitomicaceae bacterium]